MSDEDWLQHWLNRHTVDQTEDNKEIANMNLDDYAALLEELEYK